MHAIELQEYGNWREILNVVEKPIPQLGSNQVLIRMVASPINPSDLGYLQGRYGVRKPPPTVPG